ncbi:MAG TPA: Rieske 2Fe-2S domain-containing protein [Pirellulales bacterium]|jgi:metal-sulfur cluster biosynthetic enzyme/nitrite reductase/ring-hydroxylating ferredoxin subunit|nr:Rieske 2Fe-2S domain-containing protein [Pirellulales bacterium]
MAEFRRVAKVGDIPDPGKRVFELDERLIVVFHVEGRYYALDDVCTHDDGPLGEGELQGYTIACPRHGAKFDIRDGRALTMPATQPTGSYEVRVEGDDVLIQLAGSDAAEADNTAQASGTAAASSNPDQGVKSMGVSEDSVREALKQVIDPELFVNIVDLGLIYTVAVAENDGKSDVLIEMTMTSPACPAGPQLLQNSKDVVGRLESVGQVEVKLVMTPPWTPDRMTEDARDQLGIF